MVRPLLGCIPDTAVPEVSLRTIMNSLATFDQGYPVQPGQVCTADYRSFASINTNRNPTVKDASVSVQRKRAMEGSLSDGCRVPLLARPSNFKSTFLSRDMG